MPSAQALSVQLCNSFSQTATGCVEPLIGWHTSCCSVSLCISAFLFHKQTKLFKSLLLSSHILFAPLLCNHLNSDVKGTKRGVFLIQCTIFLHITRNPDKLFSKGSWRGDEIEAKQGQFVLKLVFRSLSSFLHGILSFYTCDRRSIVWPFLSLCLMMVKGEGSHCPLWPTGMFGAMHTESVESWGLAKCQAHMTTLTYLNAGRWLAVVFVPLHPCLQLLPMSHMPSGLAPHLWTSCLQSLDSSALCSDALPFSFLNSEAPAGA